MTDAFQAQSMIFNIYEIKNHSINGKVYYASEDGTDEIWYGTCGVWMVGNPSDRCVAFRQKMNLLINEKFSMQRSMYRICLL